MSDCPNAEVRDLLPELLHDRLDAPTRARVLAHVNACADCRSELELLRSMRGALERATPRVDVNRIVAALPSPSARSSQPRRTWRVLNDWRIAAAVTFLVAGGSSLIIMHNVRDGGREARDTAMIQRMTGVASETTARLDSPAVDDRQATRPAASTPAPSQPREPAPVLSRGATDAVATTDEQGSGLANSRIGDLNERQLKSLLNAIEHMDATPVTEPDPVTLHVGSRASSPTGASE